MHEMWTAPGMPKQLDYVEVKFIPEGVLVTPYFKRVDRPQGIGTVVGNIDIAYRLTDAMLDGAVFKNFTKNTDVYGKTYISAPTVIHPRRANADLNRIGF